MNAAPPTIGELRGVGLAAGLDVVEVATAEPFVEVRGALEERKEAGLHGGMAFTYRNPARSTDPARSVSGATALVVGARSYLTAPHVDDAARAADSRHAEVARYARGDHYAALRSALGEVAGLLAERGWQAKVLVDDNALVDRAAAHRAGIGWWGKNANLLLPGVGSWYVLGSVVTDAPLEVSGAPIDDRCGACTRCIDGCPTGAIVAPGVVDARRCLAWLLQADGAFPIEHRVALGGRIYGCDECQEVCPPNRRAPISSSARGGDAWVPLLDLLDPDDAVVLRWADRWYIPRREVRHVRRNALVVLGNVGDPADPALIEAVQAHLDHEDPLLRAHAVWAARRLGREDLVRPLVVDTDPLVMAELDAPVAPR